MSAEIRQGPLASWRVALVYAILGAIFTALYALYPGFRRFPLPNGPILPTAPIVSLVPIASLAWALAGSVKSKTWAARAACAACMLAALGCLGYVGLSVWNDLFRS